MIKNSQDIGQNTPAFNNEQEARQKGMNEISDDKNRWSLGINEQKENSGVKQEESNLKAFTLFKQSYLKNDRKPAQSNSMAGDLNSPGDYSITYLSPNAPAGAVQNDQKYQLHQKQFVKSQLQFPLQSRQSEAFNQEDNSNFNSAQLSSNLFQEQPGSAAATLNNKDPQALGTLNQKDSQKNLLQQASNSRSQLFQTLNGALMYQSPSSDQIKKSNTSNSNMPMSFSQYNQTNQTQILGYQNPKPNNANLNSNSNINNGSSNKHRKTISSALPISPQNAAAIVVAAAANNNANSQKNIKNKSISNNSNNNSTHYNMIHSPHTSSASNIYQPGLLNNPNTNNNNNPGGNNNINYNFNNNFSNHIPGTALGTHGSSQIHTTASQTPFHQSQLSNYYYHNSSSQPNILGPSQQQNYTSKFDKYLSFSSNISPENTISINPVSSNIQNGSSTQNANKNQYNNYFKVGSSPSIVSGKNEIDQYTREVGYNNGYTNYVNTTVQNGKITNLSNTNTPTNINNNNNSSHYMNNLNNSPNINPVSNNYFISASHTQHQHIQPPKQTFSISEIANENLQPQMIVVRGGVGERSDEDAVLNKGEINQINLKPKQTHTKTKSSDYNHEKVHSNNNRKAAETVSQIKDLSLTNDNAHPNVSNSNSSSNNINNNNNHLLQQKSEILNHTGNAFYSNNNSVSSTSNQQKVPSYSKWSIFENTAQKSTNGRNFQDDFTPFMLSLDSILNSLPTATDCIQSQKDLTPALQILDVFNELVQAQTPVSGIFYKTHKIIDRIINDFLKMLSSFEKNMNLNGSIFETQSNLTPKNQTSSSHIDSQYLQQDFLPPKINPKEIENINKILSRVESQRKFSNNNDSLAQDFLENEVIKLRSDPQFIENQKKREKEIQKLRKFQDSLTKQFGEVQNENQELKECIIEIQQQFELLKDQEKQLIKIIIAVQNRGINVDEIYNNDIIQNPNNDEDDTEVDQFQMPRKQKVQLNIPKQQGFLPADESMEENSDISVIQADLLKNVDQHYGVGGKKLNQDLKSKLKLDLDILQKQKLDNSSDSNEDQAQRGEGNAESQVNNKILPDNFDQNSMFTDKEFEVENI